MTRLRGELQPLEPALGLFAGHCGGELSPGRPRHGRGAAVEAAGCIGRRVGGGLCSGLLQRLTARSSVRRSGGHRPIRTETGDVDEIGAAGLEGRSCREVQILAAFLEGCRDRDLDRRPAPRLPVVLAHALDAEVKLARDPGAMSPAFYGVDPGRIGAPWTWAQLFVGLKTGCFVREEPVPELAGAGQYRGLTGIDSLHPMLLLPESGQAARRSSCGAVG